MMYRRLRNDAKRRAARLAAKDRDVAGRPLERLEGRLLLSTYFVATGGADANPGTIEQPLRTIQQAANRAQPGDTVFIRGGTYRETVDPPRSGAAAAPITFRGYNNETVVVSGADPLSGWNRHAGSVYKAGQSWDLGEGNNQVFVDGQMMTEARWPNTTLDVSHPRKATADSVNATFAGDASYATLNDSELGGFPAGTWDGGTLHIASGQSWVTQTATVTGSGPGQVSFDYVQRLNPKSGRFETPTAGDPYFLTGKFVALDSAGEWFYDAGDDTLYLWTPQGDSPANHAVEVKRRAYAFDLSDRSYVNVVGVGVFAATILTDADSSNIVLDGIDAEYVGHYWNSPTGWEVPLDSGLVLAGTDSVLRNSTVAYSAGHGVAVDGARNRVENNVIHDVAYSGGNGAAVRAAGADHLVRNNTIYNAGRDGVLHGRLVRSRILYNLIHDVMLQTTDGGGLYTYGTDGQGTEVAYNVIYNVNTGGFGGVGIYLDNGSNNHVVHHNLTWNVNHGIKLNPPSAANHVFNNTFVANSRGVATSGTADMTGTAFRNNIFTRQADIGATAVQEGNLYATTPPQFADPANNDYRLKSTSPAIDLGVKLPPYTDGFAGAGPDAGAIEFGRSAWSAGAGAAAVPDTTAPAAPKGLTAIAMSSGVLLDWTDGLEPDRTGYVVSRASSAAGPFTRLTAQPVNLSRYLDSGAPLDGVSYYRVTAVDSSGNVSAPASASATLRLPAAPPDAPAGLAAAPASATQIDLSWQPMDDVLGYRVERRGPGETAFREVARAAGPRFSDTGLSPGASYIYRVRAENLAGVSAPGNTATASPLAAPSGLGLTVVSGMRADLTWSNVAGEGAYFVQRSPDGQGGWQNVGYATPDVTTFSDVSVPTGETYFYRVLAAGPGGFSQPSNVVTTRAQTSAYTSLDIAGIPEGRTTVVNPDTAFDVVAGGRNVFGATDGIRFVYKPLTGDFDLRVRVTSLTAVVSTTKAGLMARDSLSSNSRNVFANATANGEMRYSHRLVVGGETTILNSGRKSTFPNVWLRLQRQGNVFTGYASTDGTTWFQTGTDTLVMPDTLYVGLATSAQSTTATTTARYRELTEQTAPVPLPPAAPATLDATAASSTQVDLQWAPSQGATTYRVERQGPGETSFTEIAADVASTSYRDEGLSPQGTYVYRVRAQNAAGRSPYGPTDSVTTPAAVPQAPQNLIAVATAADHVDLDWEPSPGAASYRLERRGPGEKVFTEVASGLVNNGYADGSVRPESTYAYRVRAENGAGLSAYGAVVSATTPAAVTGAFRGADVGDPTPAGSVATIEDGKAYDVTGGGTDVNGTTDRFYYAYQQRTGDFDVKVRVASLTRAHDWTKAGLMARESLSGGSRNAFIAATPDVNGHRISARFSDSGTTLVTGAGAVTYPNNWLRLRRVGSTFTGYRSADGVNWTSVGSRTVALPDTVYFGMAVTSHNSARTATAQFRDLADVTPTGPTAPAAPTGLAATAASTTQVDLAWTASAGATRYRVERKGPADGDFTEVATTTKPVFSDTGRTPATTYAYRVRAENAGGLSPFGDVATATTRATYTSVGISEIPAGSTTVINEGKDYDVTGGGLDIFGPTDGFRFVYRQVTGDFDVKVRIAGISSALTNARAGLMAREALTYNSRNAFASATTAEGYRFTARTETQGNTSLFRGPAATYPNAWVRLRRSGDTFTGYYSSDGVNWTEMPATTMVLPQTLYVGMAVSSFTPDSTATAQFRDLG